MHVSTSRGCMRYCLGSCLYLGYVELFYAFLQPTVLRFGPVRVITPRLPSVTLDVHSLFFKRDMAAETSLEKTATHLVVLIEARLVTSVKFLLNNSEVSSCWEHKSDVLMYGGACGGGATLPSPIRSCRRLHTSNIRLVKD